jgi:hypothetical protein
VISDQELRHAIFREHNDEDLALAFQKNGEMAHSEAMRYDGFWGGATPRSGTSSSAAKQTGRSTHADRLTANHALVCATFGTVHYLAESAQLRRA